MNEIKLEQKKKPVRIHWTPKKKVLVGVGALLLVAIIAGGVYWLQRSQSEQAKNETVCSEELLTKARPFISGDKLSELELINQEIMKLPKFEEDPNCLYVVTSYYINAGDVANSKKYLEKLKQVYKTDPGYSQALGESALTPTALGEGVKFLEQQQAEFEKNLMYGPEV